METVDGAAGAGPDGQPDLREQLGRPDHRLVRALVELASRDRPASGGRADDHRGADRGAHRRQVLGGIRLAQRPADRPAVTYDRVGDHLLGIVEDPVVLAEHRGVQQVGMPGHRADGDLVSLDADVAQVGQVVDVDQTVHVRDAQLHHREQAVPAGDDAGLGPVPFQEVEGVLDAGRAFVLEGRRSLHGHRQGEENRS